MTIEQKSIITELRRTGVGYAAIANRLGISKETVKTFCRRNGLNAAVPSIPETKNGCRNCGKSIEQKSNVKKKSFCCQNQVVKNASRMYQPEGNLLPTS